MRSWSLPSHPCLPLWWRWCSPCISGSEKFTLRRHDGMTRLSSVDEVFNLLASGGGTAYFGEPVSVLEHSLQAAAIIRDAGGGDTLVAAALLHDLGHLQHTEGEDAAERGLDTRHEELGVAALAGHLPASVLDPIRMHVAAKRYLCFAHPEYLDGLSPASRESLALQG